MQTTNFSIVLMTSITVTGTQCPAQKPMSSRLTFEDKSKAELLPENYRTWEPPINVDIRVSCQDLDLWMTNIDMLHLFLNLQVTWEDPRLEVQNMTVLAMEVPLSSGIWSPRLKINWKSETGEANHLTVFKNSSVTSIYQFQVSKRWCLRLVSSL